jgi:hypothetical protein
MAILVDWGNRIIYIPKSFLTLVQPSPEIRELNLNALRLALKDLEDGEEGMNFSDTHRHNTEVVLAGVTYSRTIEFINDYTVTFEDGQYAVNAVGANSNLADVMNVNQVSLRTSNSAGLLTVVSGSGVTEQDKLDIASATWGSDIENSITAQKVLRALLSVAAHKSVIVPGSSVHVKFRDATNTKDRIDATMGGVGGSERVDINLDLD